jgi:hypothetical protein
MGEHPVVRSRSGSVRRLLPTHRGSPPGCEAAAHHQQSVEHTPRASGHRQQAPPDHPRGAESVAGRLAVVQRGGPSRRGRVYASTP